MDKSHFESLFPADSREQEVGELIRFIKEGNACQLISLPGVGRSTVLRLLAYNKNVREKHLGEHQKWFHFVLIDFSEIKGRPLVDATKHLFLSLLNSLRERQMVEYEEANNIFKETMALSDEVVLFNGLKRVVDLLAIQKELTIIFLLDKFETYVPMLTQQFFTNLKVLQDRVKYRFVVVFSLTRAMEYLLDETVFPDFFSFIGKRSLYLNLSDNVAMHFRLGYIEHVTKQKLSENIKSEIVHLSGGHGKLMVNAVEQVMAEKPTNIESFLQENDTVRSVLYELWNTLTIEEQDALKLLCHPELDSGSPSRKIILNENEIADQARNDNDGNLALPAYLHRAHLVENGKHTLPLFASFVAYRAQKPDEKFKVAGNEIKKGKSVISDNLTGAEFRLFKFFIEHSEEIVDRNSVIEAVWSDTKSTAGVTDQALDQLIFRLRKKIEDNPNNPKHIQTVKGRGFRFAP